MHSMYIRRGRDGTHEKWQFAQETGIGNVTGCGIKLLYYVYGDTFKYEKNPADQGIRADGVGYIRCE